MSKMTVREVQRGEFRAVAEVFAAAFFDEEMIGDLMHPHRHEYPQDLIRFFEYREWKNSFDRKHKLVVAIDPNSGKIVGVADWERQGKGGEKLDYAYWDPRRLCRAFASFYTTLAFFFSPNRAADPSKMRIMEKTMPLIAYHWDGPQKENWYLDMIAVHPEYQGYKYGRALVEYGLELAARDQVYSSLIAADGKEGFYGKLGFVEVGRANVGPLAEHGIRGGAIMFTGVRSVENSEAGIVESLSPSTASHIWS